jgi:hypothetical protein
MDNPNYLLIFFTLGCIGFGIWAARRLLQMQVSAPSLGYTLPQSLGGLLLLLGIGLFCKPFIYLNSGRDLFAFLDQGMWNALTLKGSDVYHPLWAPLLLLEVAGIIIIVILSFSLWPLYLKRRASFPKAFTLVFIFTLGCEIMDMVGLKLIPSARETGAPSNTMGSLVWALLFGAAWIYYLHRNIRPQQTFVFPLAPEKVPGGEKLSEPTITQPVPEKP